MFCLLHYFIYFAFINFYKNYFSIIIIIIIILFMNNFFIKINYFNFLCSGMVCFRGYVDA